MRATSALWEWEQHSSTAVHYSTCACTSLLFHVPLPPLPPTLYHLPPSTPRATPQSPAPSHNCRKPQYHLHQDAVVCWGRWGIGDVLGGYDAGRCCGWGVWQCCVTVGWGCVLGIEVAQRGGFSIMASAAVGVGGEEGGTGRPRGPVSGWGRECTVSCEGEGKVKVKGPPQPSFLLCHPSRCTYTRFYTKTHSTVPLSTDLTPPPHLNLHYILNLTLSVLIVIVIWYLSPTAPYYFHLYPQTIPRRANINKTQIPIPIPNRRFCTYSLKNPNPPAAAPARSSPRERSTS